MKQKSHILYIVTKLELGGAQKTCLALFDAFNHQNSPTNLDTDSTAWLISGTKGILVPAVQANYNNIFLLESLKREISVHDITAFFAIFKIIKKLKKEYPDLIVHTHSTKAGYVGRFAAWCAGVKKIIHTVHGFGFHSHQARIHYWIAYFLEKLASYITTKYICVSQVDIAIGTQYFKNFATKSVLIRAAINEKKFVPAQNKNVQFSHCTYGTVACFKPQKNIFDLLEAFKQVYMYHTKNITLEIIGDGVQRPLIERWIRTNNLSEHIVLHGWQEHPETIMRNWDCFVLSSLWEGLPCAIVEARYLKLPIISYNIGGITDVIQHGKNGFVCAPKCVNLLTHYMALLSQNNYLRSTIGNYPDNLAAFTQEAMINAHKNLYTNCML